MLRAARPVDEDCLQTPQQQGLTVSRQVSFMTMTYAGEQAQLVRFKAADYRYPLYGQLLTRPEGLHPLTGSVLLAPRLLALLGLKVGDNLDVGDITLRIAGELIQEPDEGFNPFDTAPRVLMSSTDVKKTGRYSRAVALPGAICLPMMHSVSHCSAILSNRC